MRERRRSRRTSLHEGDIAAGRVEDRVGVALHGSGRRSGLDDVGDRELNELADVLQG